MNEKDERNGIELTNQNRFEWKSMKEEGKEEEEEERVGINCEDKTNSMRRG